MSPTREIATSVAAPILARETRPNRRRWPIGLGVLAILLGVGYGFWRTGSFDRLLGAEPLAIPVVAVDRGDIPIFVTESGNLESTNNATVKCQVEAMIGTVGGTSSGGGSGRRGGSLGGGSARGGASGGANSAALRTTSIKSRSGATARAGGGATAARSTGGGTTTPTMGGGMNVTRPPSIRSFSYRVTPHVPLRPRTTSSATSSSGRSRSMGGGMMGGGGSSGGGFGSSDQSEQRGSTRILWILPEGTPVKAGDVVCKLDSAAFEDELVAQRIRLDQAKAWVEQARAILEVNEISIHEYNEGILPEDRALIEAYIETCKLQLETARETLAWSIDAYQKGFRTEAQVNTDRLALQRAEISMTEALTMKRRLEEFTAPRLINNLLAKSAAVRADLLSQEASLKLEQDRLERLQKMIDYCTMTAPRDGIVVYANQANSWGRVETQIREGVTVRERQPIFNLPDPKKMSVRVKINESKISKIYVGQHASILIDAFPDRPLTGTVQEVTVIPALMGGSISDVKIYAAIVEIDSGGFEGLRPGMTAEVTFHVEDRKDVVRVPVQAIRWVADEPYVAVPTSGESAFEWRKITVGQIGPAHAEVIAGLQPGEKVAATPRVLPAPSVGRQSAAPSPTATEAETSTSPPQTVVPSAIQS